MRPEWVKVPIDTPFCRMNLLCVKANRKLELPLEIPLEDGRRLRLHGTTPRPQYVLEDQCLT